MHDVQLTGDSARISLLGDDVAVDVLNSNVTSLEVFGDSCNIAVQDVTFSDMVVCH